MGCFCVKSSGERIEELITNKTPITLNNTTDSSQIDMEMYVNNYIEREKIFLKYLKPRQKEIFLLY